MARIAESVDRLVSAADRAEPAVPPEKQGQRLKLLQESLEYLPLKALCRALRSRLVGLRKLPLWTQPLRGPLWELAFRPASSLR